MSANSDTRARFKSNKGEWISFLIVLRVIVVDELEEDEFRSGVVSTGATDSSRIRGFGLRILIATKKEWAKT